MDSKIQPPVSSGKLWGGRIMSWLPALFMLVDGVMKLFKPAVVVEGTVKLGYTENVIVPLGIVLTVCTVIYLIPRTAVLGAVVLTGYLGGATATHLRVQDPTFVVPVVVGVIIWTGLYLREGRLGSFLSTPEKA